MNRFMKNNFRLTTGRGRVRAVPGPVRNACVALVLAGCAAGGGGPADEAGLRAGQERACAIAVADHVGLGVEAVSPTWSHVAPDGHAIVEVRDGDRLHTCEVDDELRVYALLHPPAE
jgi:hypothetical protein